MTNDDEFKRYMREYEKTNRMTMLGLVNDWVFIGILVYLAVMITIVVTEGLS